MQQNEINKFAFSSGLYRVCSELIRDQAPIMAIYELKLIHIFRDTEKIRNKFRITCCSDGENKNMRHVYNSMFFLEEEFKNIFCIHKSIFFLIRYRLIFFEETFHSNYNFARYVYFLKDIK